MDPVCAQRCFAVVLALCALGAPVQAREITVPTVASGPALKGDLSDPAWQQAAAFEAFVTIDEGEASEARTEAYVVGDPEALYVAFVCHEPSGQPPRTETSGHDGPVSSDDCVQVVIDPTRGRTWVWHWVINAIGVIWDAVETPARIDNRWSARPERAVSRQPDRWVCELKFPFGMLGWKPQPGDAWGMNLCRVRQSGNKEMTAWTPAPTGFGNPQGCGVATLAPKAAPVTLASPSRGGASADANDDGRNAFVVRASEASGAPHRVALEVGADGQQLARQEFPLPARGEETMRVQYRVPQPGQPSLTFSVSVDGERQYAGAIQAAPAEYRGPKSWQLDDPLFEELLTDQPPGLRREGALVWGHLNDVSLLRQFARRFAVAYSEAGAYREHADHGFILVGHSVVRDLDDPHPIARFRVRNAPCPVRLPEGIPWRLDPAAIELALDDMAGVFRGPHPLVFGIFAGDEVADIGIKTGARLSARPGDYAYIAQADAEVREQFGGGKWGIPKGLAERDPNPYKWIAFRRWLNARMLERNRRLRDIVRAHEPTMPVISVDGGGEPGVYEISPQADLFDIFTNQHAGRGDPWRCTLGYHTKVFADLTGKEVWPCAHIEHYLVGLTAEEALEEISQVFRNGGSGLHLYLPDTGGARKLFGDTKHCLYGAPRRFHTITNVLDLMRTMPQVKLPTYGRTAILSNDDTLCAEPYDSPRPYSEQTESCYTFMGPVARSWFRFIDCAQVLKLDLAERFDVIWVPVATFQRPAVVARLREFVEQGGTLVCADPQAFSTDTLGNDTSEARREMFGVRVGEAVDARELRRAKREPGEKLLLPGEAYAMALDAEVHVLATYEDGSPALTRRSLGGGTAILFGANPFAFSSLRNSAWQRFFTEWAAELGMPTGLDIWRFRLPHSLIPDAPELPGACLTNNHVLWREERPDTSHNLDSGGSYELSPAPDAVPDEVAADGAIPFERGHLTDRRTSMNARKTGAYRGAPYALPASRWMVSWETTEPVAVTFNLGEERTLSEFRLWYCDSAPRVTLDGSPDGAQWAPLGQFTGEAAGQDVLRLCAPLEGARRARYLRATFLGREPSEALTLVEAEVWGRP